MLSGCATLFIVLAGLVQNSEPAVSKDAISIHQIRRGTMPLLEMADASVTSIAPPRVRLSFSTASRNTIRPDQTITVEVKPIVLRGKLVKVDRKDSQVTADVEFNEPFPAGIVVGQKIMASSLMRTNGFAYAEPGYLLMAMEGKLTAQQFDASALKIQGDPVTIADDIEGSFSVTDTGLLMFRKIAPDPNKQLQWYDRQGRQLGTVGTPANYGGIDLSPSQDHVSVDITANNNRDVWVLDLARGIPSRITFDRASDWSAQWSPDGNRLAFASAGRSTGTVQGTTQIYQKSSSGVGTEELVQTDGGISIP